ncbi:hypothetical protein ACJZ2D_008135 [Fusarium nematophilum]
MGHRENTWRATTADKTKLQPWPKALLPAKFQRARIFGFGYDSRVIDMKQVGGKVSPKAIGDHAKELTACLAHERRRTDTTQRQIIFVCHSLGGLVCKDAILHSKQLQPGGDGFHDVYASTIGIIFMGTPHLGSDIAYYALRMTRIISQFQQANRKLLAVLEAESEVLNRIHDDFSRIIMDQGRSRSGRQIRIVCFWEERETSRIGFIVPKASAVLPGGRARGVDADHKAMTKFAGDSHPGFIALVEELHWIRASSASTMSPLGLAVRSKEDAAAPEEEKPWFVVPYSRNEYFVGRSSILEQLNDWIGSPEENMNHGIHKTAAMYGLGGVGKTQIALEWAFDMHQKHPGLSVFWVYGGQTARFTEGYASLARACEIPNCGSSNPRMLSKVKSWLEEQTKCPWLMIIDSADDIGVFFEKTPNEPYRDNMAQYIPSSPNGAVLFTTRTKEAAVDLAPPGRYLFHVAEPSNEECVELMQRRLPPGDYPVKDLAALSEHLGRLPLALSQATAYLQKKSLSVSEYLEKLRERSDEANAKLLEAEFSEPGRGGGQPDTVVPNAVATTWLVTIQAIEHESWFAAEILDISACLGHQGVPKFLFERYTAGYQAISRGLLEATTNEPDGMENQGPADRDKSFDSPTVSLDTGSKEAYCDKSADTGPTLDSLEDALALLMAYSLFTPGKDGTLFTVHRLVHSVIRRRLYSEGRMANVASKAVTVVSHIGSNFRMSPASLVDDMMPHAVTLLAQPIREDIEVPVLSKMSLFLAVMRVILDGGTPDLLDGLLYMAGELQRLARIAGGDDFEVETRFLLARCLGIVGRPVEGVQMVEETLPAMKARLKLGDKHAILHLQTLAEMYLSLDQVEKASQLLGDIFHGIARLPPGALDGSNPEPVIKFRRAFICKVQVLCRQGRIYDALGLSRILLFVYQASENDALLEAADLALDLMVAARLDAEALFLAFSIRGFLALSSLHSALAVQKWDDQLHEMMCLKAEGRPLREGAGTENAAKLCAAAELEMSQHQCRAQHVSPSSGEFEYPEDAEEGEFEQMAVMLFRGLAREKGMKWDKWKGRSTEEISMSNSWSLAPDSCPACKAYGPLEGEPPIISKLLPEYRKGRAERHRTGLGNWAWVGCPVFQQAVTEMSPGQDGGADQLS